MIFDLTPLTATALWFLGLAFAVTFFSLSLLLRNGSRWLRVVQDKAPVCYGGAALVAVVTLLAFVATPDVGLRLSLLLASLIIVVIGVIDESIKLGPRTQFFWQIVIALIAVSGGWTIKYVSNPWSDGVISFLPVIGGLIGLVWLLLLMNAVNWLDGSDGLAGGVSVIGLATVAAVSLLPSVQDGHTLTLALIGLGSTLGFLLWNFPPAKIYLGTTGSWFLGLYLGLAAIVGGGKIVTTLLVLALPLIDFILVILQRLWNKQPPWQGDTENHIHFRLQAWGLSPRLIFIIAVAFSSILGVAAIALQTTEKIVALVIAAIILFVASIPLIILRPKKL